MLMTPTESNKILSEYMSDPQIVPSNIGELTRSQVMSYLKYVYDISALSKVWEKAKCYPVFNCVDGDWSCLIYEKDPINGVIIIDDEEMALNSFMLHDCKERNYTFGEAASLSTARYIERNIL